MGHSMKSKVAYLIGLVCLLLPWQAGARDSVLGLDGSGGLKGYSIPARTVILTFDDGPSPYTSSILEILKQENIKATFFIIGTQAIKHPLLKQIYEAGHEIGNHTLTHPRISNLSWRVTQLQLNLNRLVIESQLGHSTRLFRPPFLDLENAITDTERYQIATRIVQAGYLIVDKDLDSSDWRRPGVGRIIANAKAVESDAGVIILLHDGGGDRSETVQALPQIIDYYRGQGYRFATVSEALDISRDQIMPKLALSDKALAWLTWILVMSWMSLGTAWYSVVILSLLAIFGRALFVIGASLIQARRKVLVPGKILPCTVIVPAFNEAKVIQSSIASLLKSDHPNFTVIVIDDGSNDETYNLAKSISDPRLTVVRKENGGKASALNVGIRLASAEIVVAVDADTVFEPQTLRLLCRHFTNPRVGAVSGNVQIANRYTLLTRLQSLEYVVGFNLDRRMTDLFDCITVVPGAIGAFRKSVIARLGGFSHETVAEDTDLTISIKEAGHTIVYDDQARAYTEAPATIRSLLKQRFRWTFGTMQSVWKHRRSFLNPRQGTLGLIGLPYLVFYQIVFPLMGPFFDVSLIIGLLTQSTQQYQLIFTSFLLYTALDVFISAVALRLDRKSLRQLWIILPQRLLYRQLMYYVIVRSAVHVLQGHLVGWSKLEREGTYLARV